MLPSLIVLIMDPLSHSFTNSFQHVGRILMLPFIRICSGFEAWLRFSRLWGFGRVFDALRAFRV